MARRSQQRAAALTDNGLEGMNSSVHAGWMLVNEQEYGGIAVDMAIAGEAEVFVGKGVSGSCILLPLFGFLPFFYPFLSSFTELVWFLRPILTSSHY